MKILQYGDSRLRKQCKTITEWDEELNEVAREMVTHLQNDVNAAAIAANQVGCLSRFFVYRDDKSDCHIIINPEVLYGENYQIDAEGCLSFATNTASGNVPLYALVGRYETIEVQYVEYPTMNVKKETYNGFTARVFQHEMEHLDGNLMIDNLTGKKRDEFIARFRGTTQNNRTSKGSAGRHRSRR